MRAMFRTALIGCLLLVPGSISVADDAKGKESENLQIGEPRMQTLKGVTFFFVRTKLTLETMPVKLALAIAEVKAGLVQSHADVSGPLTVIHHGSLDDPTVTFNIEVGFPISKKVEPVKGFEVVDLPEYKCLSELYSGPLEQVTAAYDKLLPAAESAPGTRTDETRQMFLYFEAPTSANNVIHVSVGMK